MSTLHNAAVSARSAPAAINSRVTYVEWPGNTRRTIEIVRPAEADAAVSRVSVFAPVARALIGSTPGAHIEVSLPNRAIRELRVIAVESEEAVHDA
ncbi:MAG TPA: GreA/GreB family elongation factor [Casimicrobiaceae bacterium]|jgi:transcription elongation GreA/GreB family factor|nr:GreA/GreB family elongation factor [Casimicrobiaceae bacterium]